MFTDPILKQLIKKYPKPEWTDRSEFLFEDMLETIVSQQLSAKAAETIFKRFKNLFKASSFPSPEEVLRMEEGSIKQAGVSGSKTNYIKNVANAFVTHEIEIGKIKRMNDEEIITTLTKIKGVGKWSAEMILLFTLNRPDVFSFGDLGLRNAIQNLYAITDKEEILKLTKTWSPHRSLACWYLWRSLEK